MLRFVGEDMKMNRGSASYAITGAIQAAKVHICDECMWIAYLFARCGEEATLIALNLGHKDGRIPDL